MAKTISEQQIEQAALGWFEAVGFDTARGSDISPGANSHLRGSHQQVVLEPRLRSALRKINTGLPEEAVEQAVRVVMRPPEPTLEQNNRWFHRLLTDGVDVEYRTQDGEARGDKAWLVDFGHPAGNDRLVVRQFTVQCGNATRRRLLDARCHSQCHLRRLHRHAAGAGRQEYTGRFRRLRRHLRHPSGHRRWRHGADLL